MKGKVHSRTLIGRTKIKSCTGSNQVGIIYSTESDAQLYTKSAKGSSPRVLLSLNHISLEPVLNTPHKAPHTDR